MNSFGTLLRISIFGESHGDLVGVTIDGCPAGIKIEMEEFNTDLSRRKSGKIGTTPRKELDHPEFVSGFYKEHTTGAPITILFHNQNKRSGDYNDFLSTPRPGHADFTAFRKFGGYNDYRGSGHFSGRLTLGLVAAGVIAKKIIFPVFVNAQIIEAGGSSDIDQAVQKAIHRQDTIGGIIECTAENLPIGLGEPFFNPVESMISHLIYAIPAIKGVEFGSGFQAASMYGSQHNDAIINQEGKTETNHAGGINGGITNGNDLVFRTAVKPPSSTPAKQKTLNMKTGNLEELKVTGRHDVCIALRIPVIIEAAAAFVLADFMLQEQRVGRINK
ncbi:MAG: chorismate synthase [Bacteroidales bacterium]|nr:chorismate synthase [Bacteroidales bacterium]